MRRWHAPRRPTHHGPAYYDPYGDEMVHENWTTWAASIPGVMTALGLGLVVLVSVVLVVVSNVIPARSRWREIAVVGAFTVPTALFVGVGYVVATLAEPAESRWLAPVPGWGTWLSGAPGSVTTVLALLVAAALAAVLLPRVLGSPAPPSGSLSAHCA